MLIMQQIKAELGHEAKKRREEDSQTAIASASQKRGAVKGGFLNKKGGKKAPEPPSRMESLKQVFGEHPAVRERNFLCTKNIGIFVGKDRTSLNRPFPLAFVVAERLPYSFLVLFVPQGP